eukprot:7606373-Pyramimonas_sp.AAC.2
MSEKKLVGESNFRLMRWLDKVLTVSLTVSVSSLTSTPLLVSPVVVSPGSDQMHLRGSVLRPAPSYVSTFCPTC